MNRADVDATVGVRILSAATEIAFPRYPGSEGDARAIGMIEQRLRALGLETSVEEFAYDIRPALWALRGLLLWGACTVVAAGWVLQRSAATALALLALALAPGVVFLAWAPWLERLYVRPGPTRTANITAWRRASSRRLTLLFMAHHDSKSQSLTLPMRAAGTFVAVAASLSLVAIAVAAAIGREVPGEAWLAPACGLVAAAAAVALATMRSGNRSPGGVDNAGSVAILLELARTVPRRIPDDVELVFLSTGAEEDHMVGAMRWLDRHADRLRREPAYCLNLDGAGSPGRVALLERYGLGRLFSATISAAARRAAASLALRVRGVLMMPGLGIDAIPFAHRGLECLTLASGSLGRATMSVHSSADVADNLDPAALAAVYHLAVHTADELVRSPHGSRERMSSRN